MKRRTGILLALATVVSMALPTFAQDYDAKLLSPGKLVVGVAQGGLSVSTGADGKLTGYDIEYIKQLSADLDVEPEFILVDFSGLLPGLIAGRFDIASATMGRTKLRAESTDFILGPGYGFDDVAFMKRETSAEITDWQSVCGKRVGVVRGAFSHGLAASKLPDGCFNESAYPSVAEAVLDLKNGRVDVVVSARSLLRGFAKASDIPMVVSTETVRPYSFGVAISKGNPELAAKVEELTAKYIADGTMDRIMKQFGIELDWSLMEQASVPL